MQEENHVFQGLSRDNHPIKQKAELLWDAHNIRLTNRDDSTLLSITNERGPKPSGVSLMGFYVGHCVVGKYLVVFTAMDDNSQHWIYRIEEKEDGTYRAIIIFSEGDDWEEGWTYKNPIEAIGVYETELVQKVYWVDGKHQPRVINVAKLELTYDDPEVLEDKLNEAEEDNHGNPNLGTTLYTSDSFDFVRELKLREKVDISRIEGLGMFSPGTIQYAFSYYNKYEQETNIFYITPIHYISPINRGGNPEEKVSNAFKITVRELDDFEYVRVYSIHRTSIDAVPTVKLVTDLPINPDQTVNYTDSGTEGSNIDPTRLLYVGGRSIVAGCISSKDNTLFLGDITIKENVKTIEDAIDGWELDDYYYSKASDMITESTYYSYNNRLYDPTNARFKVGEIYRCGIQAQYKDGTWSEPVFIDDWILIDQFIREDTTEIAGKGIMLFKDNIDALREAGYRKVRTCVVFPRTFERNIICQGVLCPTVFNLNERLRNSVYAKSSWFFRPTTAGFNNSLGTNIFKGSSIQYMHNKSLLTGNDRGAELQTMARVDGDGAYIDYNNRIEGKEEYDSYYFVDENIVTFHSPDVEFDTNIQNLNWENVRLNIIGAVQLEAIAGDIDITTSSPTLSEAASGFNKYPIGYPTFTRFDTDELKSGNQNNGGLVSGLFYEDSALRTDYTDDNNSGNESYLSYYMVYPWHRIGSLNNDISRPASKGTRTSVLKTKRISNLKFFTRTEHNINMSYEITTPQVFMSDQMSLTKLHLDYINEDVNYLGNVDTMSFGYSGKDKNLAGQEVHGYPIYSGKIFIDEPKEIEHDRYFTHSTEPTQIKYKSSPHLVFALNSYGDYTTQLNTFALLPRHKSLIKSDGIVPDVITNTFIPPERVGSKSSPDKVDGVLGSVNFYDSVFSIRGKKKWENTYHLIYTDYSSDYRVRDAVYVHTNSFKVDQTGVYDGLKLVAKRGVTTVGFGHNYELRGVEKNTDNYAYNYNGETAADYIGPDKYYILRHVDTEGDGFGRGMKSWELEEYKPNPESEEKETVYTNIQPTFGDADKPILPYLLLAEIVNTSPELYDTDSEDYVKFGGKSEEALSQNLWLPACEAIELPEKTNADTTITVPFKYGDTWYSRYDCLKTYPYTQEDQNQIIEIGSFMCETRVNIDGRYDRNRGQYSNLNMSPQNFNLMNEIYSQKDNFFNYRILDDYIHKQDKFSNQVTWSLQKNNGEDTDTWSNITLANTLDMDGRYGKVVSIDTLNDTLLCLQEKALSQIMFNDRVQIPVSDGVPIEISNGYKVDGYKVISNSVGCQNKWSVCNTAKGLYFVDDNTDTLLLYGGEGQLVDLTEQLGMKWWFKGRAEKKIWKPYYSSSIRTFYDPIHKDVYFTPADNNEDALCFSEQLMQFTSQYSYGGTQAMLPFNSKFLSLRDNDSDTVLWKNFEGKYNKFFDDDPKEWNITFISNDNPTITKVFDTIEFRADSFNPDLLGDTYSTNEQTGQPFDFIQVENEYQDTYRVDFNSSNLRKKFRIWRALIPRNKKNSNGRDRIRNPWARITIGRSNPDTEKVELHDLSVKYTI